MLQDRNHFERLTVRDNASTDSPSTPRWDISQERAFLENLLGQRFNFFLVFFGLVIAGSIQVRALPQIQALILAFGTIVSFLMMLTLFRAQAKLDLIFGLLIKDPHHPFTVITQMAGSGGSMRRHIGKTIPIVCVSALGIMTFLAWTGTLQEWSLIELGRAIKCAP